MMRRRLRSIEKMKKPYILAKRYDWEGFGEFFRRNEHLIDEEIDLHENTPLHYAAHCGKPEMYEEMLGMVDATKIEHVLRKEDDMGNTPLHEVAFTGEVEMTRCIIERDRGLLFIRNKLGETPVYRAAALGKTKLLKTFIKDMGVDLPDHFHREADKMSILHTAVIDQFFGTALWLLKRHEELADFKEDNGLTTLQLLAKMPSTFKSQTQMGNFKNFIYLLLPNYQDREYYYLQDHDDATKGVDVESGPQGRNQQSQNGRKLSAFSWMWYTLWTALAKEWKGIDKLWRIKEMHKLAEELVELLAKKDQSWLQSYIAMDRTVSVSMGRTQRPHNIPAETKAEIQGEQTEQKAATDKPIYTPLLMAASNGITEIVEAIIHLHPQAIEHASEDEQNILYMAVKHRQKKIYRILKKLNMLRRLAGKIDSEGNTVLHHTADFIGGSQPGYALQLQEELHWFERIEKRLPYHYTIHCNKKNQTAKQLFMEKHEDLLKEARQWIKETAQSCSAVAVLVATVVFAAAYTVPGGTDDKTGLPRYLTSPIFVFFTVMDVVALVSSLASVVMFLSILTSPCEMWDFRRSLPRKLMAGFALLFFSMSTTMLSFSATILIDIKLEKNKWTSVLAYSGAFLPIGIFATMQFPLYVAMKGCLRSIFKKVKKLIPRYFLQMRKRSKRRRLWEF